MDINNSIYAFSPFSEDVNANNQAVLLKEELITEGKVSNIPAWGMLFVRNEKVICVLPKHPIDEFNEAPVMFIDETYNTQRNYFFLGALVFRSLPLILVVSRHIQNLIVLAKANEGFWPTNEPPPRLHLRELNNKSSRKKSNWKKLSRKHIELLFKTIVPSIREQSGLKLISPVDLLKLENTISKAFPNELNNQVKQLSMQFTSMQIVMMLIHSNVSVKNIEIVADHDSTPVNLGKGKRQSTLHIVDSLNKTLEGKNQEFEFFRDANIKYSSKFPDDFTLNKISTVGFPLRDLVLSVGLQFIDTYLGLWRKINETGRPSWSISHTDLGFYLIPEMKWAYENSQVK